MVHFKDAPAASGAMVCAVRLLGGAFLAEADLAGRLYGEGSVGA